MEIGELRRLKREEAEALFNKNEVISTNVEHGNNEMLVVFKLKNDLGFVVKYNLLDHQKSYYLQESAI